MHSLLGLHICKWSVNSFSNSILVFFGAACHVWLGEVLLDLVHGFLITFFWGFRGHRPVAVYRFWGAGRGVARGGVWFLFFGSFLLVLAGLLFWRGSWSLGCHLWGLGNFLVLPNFLGS